MLYYFLMKSGNLCSLDIDPLKVEVSYLKSILSKEICANEQSIILIANGGLCIQDGILGNYNCADNKENPVFVYIHQEKRTAINFVENNELNTEYFNLMERLKTILNKPGNNFAALQENESLSSLILHSSKRMQNKVEIDIRNQFLLVEGWSAALANLYDSLSSLEKRIDAMKLNLDKFFANGLVEGYEIMKKFNESKSELENVPLHSALFEGLKVENENQKHPTNLLQWVLAHDSRIKHQVTVQFLISDSHQAYGELLGISDDVCTSLEFLKENWGKLGLIGKVYENIDIGKALVSEGKPLQSIIDEDIEEMERVVEKNSHTSTKDFVNRLDCLNRFRERCENLVNLIQTHKEYMEQTVRQCRDNPGQAVLLDHCGSAKAHLENVIKNFTDLRETLHKIERSKHELTNNIDIRKTWLQKFQTKICEVDDSIFVVKEKIKRVRTGLRVLEQIQTAPKIYVKGVTEIVRRQHFLDFWYSWGIQNSKLAQEIRRKDHEARMALEQDISSHFIQTLFNSLFSFSLPKIGTPLLQSSRPVLPSISEQDIIELAEYLPQFRSMLKIDKIEPNSLMINSFIIDAVNVEPFSESAPTEFENDREDPVSLLPAPFDLNIPPIHELCLSQPKQGSSESLSNSSSKLVKSINSSDYQLTDDVTAENKKDFVCVPRAAVESLYEEINEFKSFFNEIRSDIVKSAVEKRLSTDEIKKLVIDVSNLSEKLLLQSQSDICSTDIKKMDKSSNTNIPAINNSSKSFQITHKEFIHGDLVFFFGCMVNGAMQWRMISSDNRIYFLHDNSFSDSLNFKRQRRESATGQRVADLNKSELSCMSQSQLPLNSNQMDFPSTSMPVMKGVFLSKEEYLCKKTSNRYGLPINTKFFRVTAAIDWMSRSANN